MRLLAVTVAFALTGAEVDAQQASSGATAPYDYRGIALGASLASVEALAPPERGLRLICHADDYYGPPVESCAYRDRAGEIAHLAFDNSTRRSDDNIFYFVADGADGSLHLFRISLRAEAEGQTREAIIAGFRHDIVAGLTARFGAPQEDHAVANSVGFEPGNLDSRTNWQNTSGAVEVTGPNQSEWGLDHTIRVYYDDPELASRALELRQQWRNAGAATP